MKSSMKASHDFLENLFQASDLLDAGTGGLYGKYKDMQSGVNEFCVSQVTAPDMETAEKIAK